VTHRTTILCLACLALFALVFPSAGCGTSTNVRLARTIVVTSLDDAGPGSLREALFRVLPGGVVVFDPGLSGTIALTSGPLVLSRSVWIIDGEGKIAYAQVVDNQANEPQYDPLFAALDALVKPAAP